MAQWRWPRVAVAMVLVLVLAAAEACAGPVLPQAPPNLTVRGAGAPVALQPWSYCWGTVCADGAPVERPPDVGVADTVQVSFPLPGFRFGAQFTAAGRPCSRVQSVPLGTAAEFTLRPAGPAGTYDIRLYAQDQGRSVSYTFRWTTTRDGVWPTPAASAAVLADRDGTVDSFGVEIDVENLARTPRSAAATITVISAEGRRTTIRTRWARPAQGCVPEGSVRFDGAAADGRRAAGSGSAPFRYEVTLVLDGTTYRGAATWPDDQIADREPAVALRFSPPLPKLPR